MSIPYSVGSWDYEILGNHRVVVNVPFQADAVQVNIPWRRRDQDPEQKNIILVDAATGQRITNLVRKRIDREAGELIFQPITAPGLVYIYYLPFSGTYQAPYPQITYQSPEETADAAWLLKNNSSLQDLPNAEVLEFQAIDKLNSFYPMEIIAFESEVAELISKYPNKTYFVFSEDRDFPIRMSSDIPQRWIDSGPQHPILGKADRGEFFVFQVGVFAAHKKLKSVEIEFRDLHLKNGGIAIPADAIRCFNLGGVDWTGKKFDKEINIGMGQVQAFWCGIQIPEDAIPGEYEGKLLVTVPGLESTPVSICINVSRDLSSDGGDDKPRQLSRLRWLDSTIALDDEIVTPFIPIATSDSTLEILGRQVVLDSSGLPKSMQSFFAVEMTRIEKVGREILTAPIRLICRDSFNQDLKCKFSKFEWVRKTKGLAAWRSSATAGNLHLSLEGSLEFDGTMEYSLEVSARQDTVLTDFILEISLNAEAARYMLGLGRPGGYRPSNYTWKWDVKNKNQDSLWLGDVNAGLQITLKDETYVRPLNTNYYTLKPLNSPYAWDNDGLGGIKFDDKNDSCLVRCFSGRHTLNAGDRLSFDFRLAITPFKTIDTQSQWKTRYFHQYMPAKEIAATGANTVNIHHANEINPFINYPFLVPDAMKAYVQEAHQVGLKVKIYYTVRELTNHAPEIFALRSLGNEIFSSGPGGGHPWLQEHFDKNYVPGWHVHAIKDVAVVNSGTSRWHNFYLEGLDWLARNIQIDGLYIDDLAFDRVVMKRVRKILERRRPGSMIDLHSANQFRERDGYANSANLYMEHFPYLDRLWFGEYFDYNLPPDFWLTEVSGIPFGLMGEMLQDNGNKWRGMLFGMTGRSPRTDDPQHMWKFWDLFGIQDSEMIGHWVPDSPVRSNREDVPITLYLKEKKALISIASWAPDTVTIDLSFDWQRLGIDSSHVVIRAPKIEKFQEEAEFRPGDQIPVDPGQGWLLIVEQVD